MKLGGTETGGWTYFDSCKRLVANVELEVSVACVIEGLAEAAESFAEHLRADSFFIRVILHGNVCFLSLRSGRFGSRPKEFPLAANFHDSLHQFFLRNLAVGVLVHLLVLRLERLRVVSSILLHDLCDEVFALVPVENVVLVQVQRLEHVLDSRSELSLCNRFSGAHSASQID